MLRAANEKVDLCFHCLGRRTRDDGLGSMMAALAPKPQSHASCPFCGWTQERVAKEELLGCPLCYQVFLDSLEMLRRPSTTSTKLASI